MTSVPSLQQLERAVLKLHENPEASVFTSPVDITYFPDYLDVITHPMDLGRVLRKLRSKRYSSPSECQDDISLVWNNCRFYNDSESEIVQTVDRLQKQFEKDVLLEDDEAKGEGSGTDDKQDSARETRSSRKPAPEPTTKNKQRAIFASKLLELSNTRMAKVVAFLYENCPAAISFDDYTTSKSRENRLTIVVEKIDETTFGKVYQNANDPSFKLEIKSLSYESEQSSAKRKADVFPPPSIRTNPPIRTYKIRDICQIDVETGNIMAVHAGVSAVSRATGVNRSTVYSILDNHRTTKEGWTLEYDSDRKKRVGGKKRAARRAPSTKKPAPSSKKRRISFGASNEGRRPVAVAEVDNETQEVVRRFPTMSAAARHHNCGLSIIQKAVGGGDVDFGGVTLRVGTPEPEEERDDSSTEELNSSPDESSESEGEESSESATGLQSIPAKTRRSRYHSVTVAECDAKTGKVRRIFPSMSAAAEAVGIDRKRVKRIMDGKLKVADWNGLTWKTVPQQSCVAECDAETGSIRNIYRSRTAASEAVGIGRPALKDILDGKTSSWNGISFKYCASDASVVDDDESVSEEAETLSEEEESDADKEESMSSESGTQSWPHHRSHKTTELDVKTGAVRKIYRSRSEAVRRTGVSWTIFRKIYSGEMTDWNGVAWRPHRSTDIKPKRQDPTKKQIRHKGREPPKKRDPPQRQDPPKNKDPPTKQSVPKNRNPPKKQTRNPRKESGRSRFYHPAVPVAECDANTGKVRRVFKSMSLAAKKSGASRHAVRRALDGEEPAEGERITWRYLTADEMALESPSTAAAKAASVYIAAVKKNDELTAAPPG